MKFGDKVKIIKSGFYEGAIGELVGFQGDPVISDYLVTLCTASGHYVSRCFAEGEFEAILPDPETHHIPEDYDIYHTDVLPGSWKNPY